MQYLCILLVGMQELCIFMVGILHGHIYRVYGWDLGQKMTIDYCIINCIEKIQTHYRKLYRSRIENYIDVEQKTIGFKRRQLNKAKEKFPSQIKYEKENLAITFRMNDSIAQLSKSLLFCCRHSFNSISISLVLILTHLIPSCSNNS